MLGSADDGAAAGARNLSRLADRPESADAGCTPAHRRQRQPGSVLLYWEIGRDILLRQSAEGWGTAVIDRLARDLRRDYPDMTGLSPRNLKYLRAFAEAWPDPAIVQQLVAQLPWGHNIRLLEALEQPEERALRA